MHDILSWLDSQQSQMVDLAQRWSEINTHSTNLTGLKIFSKELTAAFRVLDESVESIPLPKYPIINTSGEQEERATAPALAVTKRPGAPWQLLCVGHMDTVFPAESSFQECTVIDDQTIRGPGITDMKGGLVVLLYALQALERCEWKDKVGWKVLINPDEEIGSPASSPLLRDMAGGRDLGLVFEPSLPNGDLVGDRKGSGNFTLVARGKAAHAGRNPQEGRSAIDAVAAWITEVKAFFRDQQELTINMGTISGGSAFNVIADLALVRFNVRCLNSQMRTYFEEQIPLINHRISAEHMVALEMHGTFQAPPKPLSDELRVLFDILRECSADLGFDLNWQHSGGVCDGNRLAAAGLPTIDTLGVIGGNIHSPQEYVKTESFAQRAKLVILFIHRWLQHKEASYG